MEFTNKIGTCSYKSQWGNLEGVENNLGANQFSADVRLTTIKICKPVKGEHVKDW
jgi:hypothetical protein